MITWGISEARNLGRSVTSRRFYVLDRLLMCLCRDADISNIRPVVTFHPSINRFKFIASFSARFIVPLPRLTAMTT